LKEKIQETQNLEDLKVKQTGVVAELNQKEQQLKEQLDANKRAVEKLENMIAQMVEREIKRSQQRIKNREKDTNNASSESKVSSKNHRAKSRRTQSSNVIFSTQRKNAVASTKWLYF
jgi:uncharacterized protein (DUF342 family)